jgi:hypothetical protein
VLGELTAAAPTQEKQPRPDRCPGARCRRSRIR